MLRIGVGIAIVAMIFIRSPHRTDADLLPDASSLARIQSDLTVAALRSEIGQTLATATLRRTIEEQTPHHASGFASPEPARVGASR